MNYSASNCMCILLGQQNMSEVDLVPLRHATIGTSQQCEGEAAPDLLR